MRASILVFVVALGTSLVANLSRAQFTNAYPVAPATKLESFETNIGSVIIKATAEVGSVSVNSGLVSVRCREITDAASGHKEQGIAIELTQRDQPKDRLLIDYDEIVSLLNAIDYFNRLDFSVTPLNSFDAIFTTRGGFRIEAIGAQRTSAIHFSVRDTRTSLPAILFSREEISRFRALIDQAKAKLDSLGGR